MSYDLFYNYKVVQSNDEKVEIFFKKTPKIKTKMTTEYNDNYFIGVLEIPKIKLKRGFVNPFSSHNNIDENITILKPFMMPNEDNSTFILAAHSGNSNVSYFNNLSRLKNKDDVYIYYKKIKYRYEITDYYEEKKDGDIVIKNHNNIEKIVLTTCNGYNKQLVYVAELKDKSFY